MKKSKWVYDRDAIVKLHGDQLYSWFREKFRLHKDALTRRECLALVGYAVDDARRIPR